MVTLPQGSRDRSVVEALMVVRGVGLQISMALPLADSDLDSVRCLSGCSKGEHVFRVRDKPQSVGGLPPMCF
jgi:hypothetical protein